jgi:hypothetical protein
MFPPTWARRRARERLGIEPDEINGGHYISLSRPRELAERLGAYALEAGIEREPLGRSRSTVAGDSPI